MKRKKAKGRQGKKAKVKTKDAKKRVRGRGGKKLGDPRAAIERMISKNRLDGLLMRAGELHGHYCSYLSMGVKAGALGIKELGLSSDGMEGVIAIIETNNCFSDGVQYATACSFGNNALIYRDYGKTAVTLARRDGNGIRISVRPDIHDVWKDKYPEEDALFKLVVRDRGGTEEDQRRMKEVSLTMSFDILKLPPEEVFNIERVKVKVPAYAPIFDSVICDRCGESVMATRIVKKGGKDLCIPCSGEGHLEMDGSGLKREETSD